MLGSTKPLHRGHPEIDLSFYEAVIRQRGQFNLVKDHTVERGHGYGFEVEAGQTFRFTTVEAAQIIDCCIFNRDDPSEHLAVGTQLALEGMHVTRFTPIWGTPPESRMLAMCVGDTIRPRDNPEHARDHICHSGHCNPHHWMLYTQTHPRTCYDNLRAGAAMVGLSQRHIHDNLNLFQKSALDRYDGLFLIRPSDSEDGDFLEFYAELPLKVLISLCPYGGGGIEPVEWSETAIPLHPVRVSVYDTSMDGSAESGGEV